ncbi:hypothetical protein [Xanthomonas sp. 3307]|uniref:hypothetical protein n=1 Tax=Xanthomonas sp. 3307 TaxID=3035316 RepID=UPI001617AD39|nr:hypothetical protein [Xanthomonas sp. 3307]MBB5941216.1 hypothetical protein [Xanthomonas sp. 3307]
MPTYAIEARSFCVVGIASHNFWVLRDEQGNALAELHGLATDRATGHAIPIGTDEARHSLRAWHYPHTHEYAQSIGAQIDSTSFLRDDQPSRIVVTGDKDHILARWNAAVQAIAELNAMDLDYPRYGIKLFGKTINSNAAYRTFGELMDVPVPAFYGRLAPGLASCMLDRERTEALRYREQSALDRRGTPLMGNRA